MIDNKVKEVIFYHITSVPIEKPLADLVTKLYEKKERTLIVCNNDTQMTDINNMLWSFSTKKFIPHGSIADDCPEQQPILISTSTKSLENEPSTVVLLAPVNINDANNFTKYIYMFYGNDSDQDVISMNDLYEKYRHCREYSIKYWSLDINGKWIAH